MNDDLIDCYSNFEYNMINENHLKLVNNIKKLCMINLEDNFLILDSNYVIPENQEILKALDCFNNLLISGAIVENKIPSEMRDLVEAGDLGNIIKYIDKNSAIKDKDFVKLQVFQKLRNEKGENFAVRDIENILDKIEINESLSIEAAIIIANIALGTMKDAYILKFIKYIVDNYYNYEHLVRAYDFSIRLRSKKNQNEIEKILEKRFPDSEKLEYIKLNKFLNVNDFKGAFDYVINKNFDIELKDYLKFNCENIKLISDDPIRFLELTSINISKFYLKNFNLVKEFLLIDKKFHLLYQVITNLPCKIDENYLFRSKIEIIEDIFLLPLEEVEDSIHLNLAFEIFEDVFNSFIEQNEIIKAYTDIDRLLSHERSQSLGSIFLYRLLFKKIEILRYDIIDNNDYLDLFEQEDKVDINKMLNFYESINSYFFEKIKIIIMDGSYFDLPEDNFRMSQHDVDSLIKFLFRISVESIGQDGYFEILNRNLFIVYNLARKSKFKNVDLYFLTNILNKLAIKGYIQPVRDMMLNLFIFAQNDLERRRLACSSYADISLRLKDPICSLSHIVFSMTKKMDIHSFYSLFEITIRALRDLKLYNYSLQFLNFLDNKLLSFNENFYKSVSHKINFLKFSIKMNQVLTGNEQEYCEFIIELLNFYNHEKSLDHEVEPIIIILLQMYKYALDYNFVVSNDFIYVIEGVKDYKGNGLINKLLRLIFGHDFSVVFDTYKEILNTNYSENLEKDFINFRTIVKSNLNSLNVFSSMEYIFILEMLVDNTYSDINSNFFGKNIKSYEDLSAFVSEFNEVLAEVDIFYLTLDQHNNLVVCHCSNENNINILKYPDFNFKKYQDWNLKYPRDYGYYDAEKDGNLFYESFSAFNIASEIEFNQNSIFFLDPLIHSITPKLFNSNSMFWGNIKSVSLSPSIRWLSNNILFQHSQSENGVLKAWISDDDANGYLLNSMASSFSEKGGVFEKYNIELDRTHGLPKDISNSKLAIIAAHGGVSYTNSNFSTISDEGNLRVHYLDFAERIQNCTVVILFVCNSGRFDTHPEYSTTISLQKELLNKGCSAVIASPWPLKGFMTFKWLPEFMKSWVDEKKQLQEAVFDANTYIQNYYNDPSDSLALTIYGNPFLQY